MANHQRMLRLASYLVVLIAVFACKGRDATVVARGADASSSPAALIDSVVDSLAMADSDRVLLVERGMSRHVLWQRRTASTWANYWESEDVYGSQPVATLSDFNVDGRPDLFFALEFEELAGAAFVISRPTGAAVDITVPGPHCVRPELVSTRPALIRSRKPGAEPDCRAMDVCSGRFVTDIPVTFRFDGDTILEERLSMSTRQQLSKDFRREADRADSLFKAKAPFPGSSTTYSEACGSALPARLRALADSLMRS